LLDRVRAGELALGLAIPVLRVVEVSLERVHDTVQPGAERGLLLLDDLVRRLPLAGGQVQRDAPQGMQAGADALPGTVARFRLEADTEKRIATVSAELHCFLNEERAFRRWFDQLNYSTRKWIADWISQVKSAEARARRAEQVAEQLLATMEAERELPPILKLAFARDPHALAGWQRMSPSHRRGHLLAIFYYRSPDARDRRIAKMLEDALAFAEKKTIKKIRARKD